MCMCPGSHEKPISISTGNLDVHASQQAGPRPWMSQYVTMISCPHLQVYLGKWHNSECAVKCLNPSLFFSEGAGGQVSMAAITDLIHEADLLGGLRHPNVVWVYGIVLPRLDDSEDGFSNVRNDLWVGLHCGSSCGRLTLLQFVALVAECLINWQTAVASAPGGWHQCIFLTGHTQRGCRYSTLQEAY
jgi:hypothetical protein